MKLELDNSTELITVEDLMKFPHSVKIAFEEALSLFASPDNGKELQLSDSGDSLNDGDFSFPIKNGLPVLYPKSINAAFLQNGLELDYFKESQLQYFLLSQIKQKGEINASSDSIPYQRHLFRMKNFLKEFGGMVLDIGCDNIDIGAALLSENSRYLGLDPFASDSEKFKVVGVGEKLPFKNEVFDLAIFNTSLDHILDYHTAIEEAYRVLKPGGVLVICSLIWLEKASLLNDSVHFHHFRDFEIIGSISQYGEVIKQKRYTYKDDKHRYGLFVASKKVG